MILSQEGDGFTSGNLSGYARFKNVTSEVKVSLDEKKTYYSMDGDGTLYANKDEGTHEVFGYNADSSASVNATVAVSQGTVFRNYPQVFLKSIASNEDYQADVDGGRAEKTLSIRTGAENGSNGRMGDEIKKLEFETSVKQVMSCRHHLDDAEADDIYILLSDGNIKRVNGTQLFDDGVAAEDLEMEDIVVEYEGDEEGEKYLGGFAVYGKRCVVFGSSGLYVADLE